MTSKKARPARDGDPDPRVNVYRPDLAAENLRDVYRADKYYEGQTRRVTAPAAPLRAEGRTDARLGTEVLFGETVKVYELRDGWAWAQATLDRYVGYMPEGCLGEDGGEPTHRVAVPRSLVFPEPDLKAPPLMALPMNSRVRVVEEQGGFGRLAAGGWIFARHLAAAGAVAEDYVATARLHLGVPYLWGGRTSAGLDCSGLVQTVLLRAGVSAPRDSDMQLAELGDPVPVDAYPDRLLRGDLVFFPSHVGIMDDAEYLLHANALSMNVARQPLAEFVNILEAKLGKSITGIRRLRAAGVPSTG
jgi:cell wall-associated NlpC family hydrolase